MLLLHPKVVTTGARQHTTHLHSLSLALHTMRVRLCRMRLANLIRSIICSQMMQGPRTEPASDAGRGGSTAVVLRESRLRPSAAHYADAVLGWTYCTSQQQSSHRSITVLVSTYSKYKRTCDF